MILIMVQRPNKQIYAGHGQRQNTPTPTFVSGSCPGEDQQDRFSWWPSWVWIFDQVPWTEVASASGGVTRTDCFRYLDRSRAHVNTTMHISGCDRHTPTKRPDHHHHVREVLSDQQHLWTWQNYVMPCLCLSQVVSSQCCKSRLPGLILAHPNKTLVEEHGFDFMISSISLFHQR